MLYHNNLIRIISTSNYLRILPFNAHHQIPTTTDPGRKVLSLYLCHMENAGIFKFFKPKRLNVTRIIIVDDAILLDGIKSLLEKEQHLRVDKTFQSAEEALRYFETEDTDLLITDFNLPGMDRLSLIHTHQTNEARYAYRGLCRGF
jgi:hypothetical protein